MLSLKKYKYIIYCMPEEENEFGKKHKTVWDLLLDSFEQQEQTRKGKLKGAL
jgi:L-rhamnose mutarotase